jgi:putative inorganic carbon (hco3(-)) transporter
MTASTRSRSARSSTPPRAGWLIPAAIVLLPLACWPGVVRPFSVPKLWWIAAVDVLVAVQCLRRGPSLVSRLRSGALPAWPWLAWIAVVSLGAARSSYLSPEAFLLLVLPLPLYLAGGDTARALCIGSAIESAIVVLQFVHRDPFLWLGWQPEASASSRMRVYGTLGNPDFVAAWLCATLPLCALTRAGIGRAAFVALQVAAIFCTGSRVFLLAVPAAALATLLYSRRLSAWWLTALPVMAAIVWLSPARPLGATVQGRLRLARVTVAHLHEVPIAGYGAGSFEIMFDRWRRAWRRDHPPGSAPTGPVDHAHNDYLELWVEYGPIALVAFLVLCGWLFAGARHADAPAGAVAALAALLAVACVDFPFHRPAEWALLFVVAGLIRRTGPCRSR